MRTVELLKQINGYSGNNKVMSIFKPLINGGNRYWVPDACLFVCS